MPKRALDRVQAERNRVAQALHDTTCQTLSGTYLQAALLVRKLQANRTVTLEEVQTLRDTLHRAVGELHQVVQTLREGEGPP